MSDAPVAAYPEILPTARLHSDLQASCTVLHAYGREQLGPFWRAIVGNRGVGSHSVKWYGSRLRRTIQYLDEPLWCSVLLDRGHQGTMPAPQRARTTYSIVPAQLRIGDRFTDADGVWEIVSQPVTLKQRDEVRARVQRPGSPGTARQIAWPAYEKLTITRALWACTGCESSRTVLAVFLALLQFAGVAASGWTFLSPGRGCTSVFVQQTRDRRDQVGRFEWLRDVHLEPGR